MKKSISIILSLVLAVGLCACGGGESKTQTKEEVLNSAVLFDFNTFVSEAEANEARAKQAYVGGTYSVSGFIKSIEDDCCLISPLVDPRKDSFGIHYATVYLPAETLIELNTGERITVAGVCEGINTTKQTSGNNIIFETAYYVDNSYSYEVTVLSVIYSPADLTPMYCIARVNGIVDNNYQPLCKIEFSGDELSSLEEEQVIVVKGNAKTLLVDSNNIVNYSNERVCFAINNAEIV